MQKFLIINLLSFVCLRVNSQPAPATHQKEIVSVVGADIHIGNGEVIPNGCIMFQDGIISYVGNDHNVAKNGKIIKAEGKQLYPGFIAVCSEIGLTEIEQVKATHDNREIGKFNPNVRSIVAYNTDSKIIPTLRSNGVLMAQVMPTGGTITGQSSVVQLDAWNWEDAVYQIDGAIHLFWPSIRQERGWWGEPEKPESNLNYQREKDEILQYFQEAKAYSHRIKVEEKHLGFEAMRGLFGGQKKLFIHCNQAKGMVQAILFAKSLGLESILVANSDVQYIVEFLSDQNIPVVLSQTHRLPGRADEDIDINFTLPLLLSKAGILFCLKMEGYWQFRNLAFQAGQAASYGLPYERSLGLITLQAAKILGIEKRCGSLELGKDANFFISEGDALDMLGNKVTMAFIQGREVNLDNKQKELYRRYWEKYHPTN